MEFTKEFSTLRIASAQKADDLIEEMKTMKLKVGKKLHLEFGGRAVTRNKEVVPSMIGISTVSEPQGQLWLWAQEMVEKLKSLGYKTNPDWHEVPDALGRLKFPMWNAVLLHD